MLNTFLSKGEIKLRVVCGSLLWLISGILTAGLFLSLAGQDLAKKEVLLALAFGLEGAKILSWRMGGFYRILAVSLIGLSVLSSFGAALQTVEKNRLERLSLTNQATRESSLYLREESELRLIDARINALIKRIEILPPDYTSALRELNKEINKLQETRTQLRIQLELPDQKGNLILQTQVTDQSMFDLISRSFGVETGQVEFITLMVLALNLEIAAIVLFHRSRYALSSIAQNKIRDSEIVGTDPTSVHTERKVSPEDFLDAMKESNELPLLRGRDTTALKLGISSAQAKRIVKELMRTKKIEAKGKRLILVD